MTESKQATAKSSYSDLLAENERLRAQLAYLREALRTVFNWSGDCTTGESVYDYARAALKRTEGEE